MSHVVVVFVVATVIVMMMMMMTMMLLENMMLMPTENLNIRWNFHTMNIHVVVGSSPP